MYRARISRERVVQFSIGGEVHTGGKKNFLDQALYYTVAAASIIEIYDDFETRRLGLY